MANILDLKNHCNTLILYSGVHIFICLKFLSSAI